MSAPPASRASLEARLIRPNERFFPNLDFMRSLGVLLVVFDHTMYAMYRGSFRSWRFGYLGVTGVFIFFVHTALVLLWSLERKPFTLDFYIRRIFRVYPLAILGTLAVAVTQAPLWYGEIPYLKNPPPFAWPNFWANIFLVFNLVDPMTGARPWMPDASPAFHAMLHVEWTLPWEVQMYLLLPMLYAFFRRERSLRAVFVLWALAVQLDLHYHVTPLSFPGSIPNFLGGVIAFVGFARFEPRLPAWLFPVFLLGMIACLVHTPNLEFSWVFTAILGGMLPFFHQFRPGVFARACHLVARYSYGIYLAHPFGIWLSIGMLWRHARWVQLSAEVLATAALAVGGYHLLEMPMIRLGAALAAKLEARAQSQGNLHAI